MFIMQAAELESQLFEVLRKVGLGHDVLITRDGRIVARLSPWSKQKQSISNHLQATEAIRKFKRIRLPKGEKVEDLIAKGRHRY